MASSKAAVKPLIADWMVGSLASTYLLWRLEMMDDYVMTLLDDAGHWPVSALRPRRSGLHPADRVENYGGQRVYQLLLQRPRREKRVYDGSRTMEKSAWGRGRRSRTRKLGGLSNCCARRCIRRSGARETRACQGSATGVRCFPWHPRRAAGAGTGEPVHSKRNYCRQYPSR